MPTLPYLFNIVLEVLAGAIRQQKEIKGYKTERKSKISLIPDDMILYLSDLKNFIRKLLQLINNLSKVAGYKVKSYKSVAFLYPKDKHAGKEVGEMIPFTIVTNNMKYLGVILTKQEKDVYE